MSAFLQTLMENRRKFLDGLDANSGAINLDIFEDFYPDLAHFVFELLQNAEDAGATEAEFMLTESGCWFEHDGARSFTEADVDAITGIHNSKKSSDQIGQFGIGFKSVFVYTQSPTIYSADFSFKITKYIMPEPVEVDPNIGNRTKFWLPFNNPNKTPEIAYFEIAAGLNELAETTLLFLPNIASIKWQIGDELTGEVLRINHSRAHIEVLKQATGQTTTSAHFLKFDQAAKGLEKHRVAIAFALDFLPNVETVSGAKPLAQQLKIVPVQGQVAVFFPAKKETSGLRFNIHAPFVPELSRASIKDTPANDPLFDQLAELCARTMHEIRSLGFLTRDFLNVLPNAQDALGERYKKIRKKVTEAFNEQALMPTFTRHHAPAKELYQAKASLKDLLTDDDIVLLTDHGNVAPKWAANRDLQGTNTERFMSGLAIRTWDIDIFFQTIIERADETEPDEEFMKWISTKPAEWFQRLYAMLANEPEMEDEICMLSNSKIIRLSDGTFSTAEKSSFPDEDRRYIKIVSCVDPDVLETGGNKTRKKAARKFLKEAGVKEIGEQQLVEALLKKEYSDTEHPLNEKNYLAHLMRFIKFESENSSASEMLKNYNLFLGEDIKWHRASDIYLDTPFGDTGLSDYYSITGQSKDRTPLAAFYQDLLKDTQELVRFAEALGAKKYIDFRKVSCMGNPEWKYLRDAARGERITSSIDDDFRIDNFDTLVSAKSIRIANLIWDSLSYRTTSSKNWQNILRATYQKTRSGGPVYSHSQVVHKLKEAAWVPQGNRFVCPADARAELLPNGFMFDPSWQWIKEIEFGKNIEQKIERERAAEEEFVEIKKRRYAAALELGFKADDDLLWLEKAAAIPPDQILRMFDEWNASQIKSTFPQHEPRNPERRADKVGAMAAEAPFKRTEERQRSVPVGRSDVKTETTQYLINQYKIEADVICQICKKPMPFKLDNGDPYFEKVEFLPELIRHHPQNYLALCPNDAAMFMYANGSKKLLLGKLNFISGEKIDVLLAQKNETIFFTKTHIADLKKVIEVDGVIVPMA